MKYKAKESYKKLDDSKNYLAHQSQAKHYRLMAGEFIEITKVPKALESHLESADKSSKKGAE